MKRQVDVKSSSTTNASESRKSEATQAAIAKMNRSTVNGRPTMKRMGSFTKGAQSPKRSKRSGSILSHGETSTVVLRKETRNQRDPELTPRTSMNRFLDANIFSDYSELAMVSIFFCCKGVNGFADILFVFFKLVTFKNGSGSSRRSSRRTRKSIIFSISCISLSSYTKDTSRHTTSISKSHVGSSSYCS